MSIRKVTVLILICILAQGCASWRKNYSNPLPPGEVALRKITDPARIPDFRPAFGNRAGLERSIDNSLEYFDHPSSKGFFPYLTITHDQAVQSLKQFKEVLKAAASPDDLQRRIVADFDVYESVGCDYKGTVLFTGYCTPIYDASRTPGAVFRYPLYKLPPDLVKDDRGQALGRKTESGVIVPYYTRAEIQLGDRLKGQELIYLKDPLEAYLVHVQGSAKLRMPDGSFLEVGYAGKNGRDYRSLREMLVEAGKIDRDTASLASIREYFRNNPKDVEAFLLRNDSFIFFTERPGGPYGSLNVPVSEYASLATDKNQLPEVYPRGCIAFIQTKLPFVNKARAGKVEMLPYSGFAMDQDNGGAIRSAGRADLYLGVGPDAEMLAGHTMNEGKIFYIFVKPSLLRPRT